MLLTKLNQLHQGQEVFRGCYVPGGVYAEVKCFELTVDPYLTQHGSHFVDAKLINVQLKGKSVSILSYDVIDEEWQPSPYQNKGIQQFSTCDAGVEQDPRYNQHALFDNVQEAMQHVEDMAAGKKPPTGGHAILTVITATPQVDTDDDAYDRAMGPI